jgi:hypothetical protein
MVELTPASLAAELKRRQKLIHDGAKKKMKAAAAMVEGDAKVYCTPGESKYETQQMRKAPFQWGYLRAAMGSDVIEEKDAIVGIVSNSQNQYNLEVHEGTSRMGGRPFITDSIRDDKEKIDQMLGSSVSEGCR